ncbi:unnamed protein product [Pieris brassicae]|uniref:Ig-like domain-containing protein n=1 Tax=Pieris brassicae TaxID=7116 RepID=A0A9P0TCP3_PIEBR|nr:unnamed protein product [Pieris brassicae]
MQHSDQTHQSLLSTNPSKLEFKELVVPMPPEKPVVVDRWGRVINTTTLGPHEEGDDVLLTCRVLGGRPEPSVRWLVNGVLVDEEYEHNTGDVIENRLMWPAIRRADYAAVFTCQAANSHLVPPKEVSLVLDMFLRPLTVEIKKPAELGEGGVLTSERRYEVSCESAGSRPPAIITWFKGKRQLKRITENLSTMQGFIISSVHADQVASYEVYSNWIE